MNHTIRFPSPAISIRIATLALLAVSLLISTSSAYATPLAIGTAIPSAPGAGPAGGTVVANSGPVAINAATFTGTLTSEVILNDPANPFGPGNLTFTYLLTNDPGVHDSLGRLTVPGYGVPGLLTDASYQGLVPLGSVLPTSFDRSSDPLGDVVGTSFTDAPLGLGAIPPGSSSALIVIQTNTNRFDNSTAGVIDGSIYEVATFAPLNSVPEPSTLILGMLGLAGIVPLARRRFAI